MQAALAGYTQLAEYVKAHPESRPVFEEVRALVVRMAAMRGARSTPPTLSPGTMSHHKTGTDGAPSSHRSLSQLLVPIPRGKCAFNYDLPVGSQARLLRPNGRAILNYSSIF